MSVRQVTTNNIWPLLPHPSPDHLVRLYYRSGDGKRKGGDYARDKRELRRFIKAHSQDNVYLAPNPTMQAAKTRHSTDDVTHWSYIFIDVDPLKTAVEPDPMNALEFTLIWLGTAAEIGIDFTEGSPDRPLIIDSGRGCQAWIRLDDVPFDAGRITRKQARKAMSYWLKRLAQSVGTMSECVIDTSCSDLPRLMRCPGTFNTKTGRPTRIEHYRDTPYVGLAEKLIAGTPEHVFEERETDEVIPGRSWKQVFPELTKMAQDYLLNGMTEGGRHKVLWHSAKKFCELGVERAEAFKALSRANKLQGLDQMLEPAEISHALDTAYGERKKA